MNLLDKLSESLANSVDYLVDKNRQLAQLNRLSAVIKTETDVIDRAYIALGKQYFKILEGTADENDMTQVCEVIKFSEERLKKAQARYDYVKVYGVPASPVDSMEMNRKPQSVSENEDFFAEEPAAQNEIEEDENADITIAVAGEELQAEEEAAGDTAPAEEAAAPTEEPVAPAEETAPPEEQTAEAEEKAPAEEEVSGQQDNEDTERIIAEKAAETVSYLKKRRGRREPDDTEAAND